MIKSKSSTKAILILASVVFLSSGLYAYNQETNKTKYYQHLKNLNKSIVLEGKKALTDKTYIDFGVEGHLYPIKEKNFLDALRESKVNLKKYLSKDYIKEQLTKAVEKYSDYKTKVSLCMKDAIVGPLIDYSKIPTDIINPEGRVVYRKGERIPSKLPDGQSLYLCFINGAGNKITTINQIRFFYKKYPQCIFLVSNYDILELRKEFPGLDLYPNSKLFESRFSPKCYPSVIKFYSDKKEYYYYSYDQFKN